MLIKIGSYQWRPVCFEELKSLKAEIGCFLKEYAAGRRFSIDHPLEVEAEKWFKKSRFPKNYLMKACDSPITIRGDDLGFPFEILCCDGLFLGQQYKIIRETSPRFQPNPNQKICYQLEDSDDAFPYYEYMEKNFPVELLEPALSECISANIFHISGHFEKEEKEKIRRLDIKKDTLLFFNSCSSYNLKDVETVRRLCHYVLSYFDIPLDEPRLVEDFPYFFYDNLLEGIPLAEAFLKARQKYIDLYGRLTPLLFTLFTSNPEVLIFNTPFAYHHKKVEKMIRRVEKDLHRLKDNEKYPFFLFEVELGKHISLQSIINSTEKNIWIHGAKAGIGKTTLLYQAMQLFKYGKFKGPIFFSFSEHKDLKNIYLDDLKKYLANYLEIGSIKGRFPRNGKRYLILMDDIEEHSFLYNHFNSFVEELQEIFGPCLIVIASRAKCPVDNFLVLSMDINRGDSNARRLRSCYHIEENIKLPEIPLIYRLFSSVRENISYSTVLPELEDKSRVIRKFVYYFQERISFDNNLEMMPETFQRYFSLLAYWQFKNNKVPLMMRKFVDCLKQFRQEHREESDWWIYDKERGSYRDAESVCRFLLDTDIIVEENDNLLFIHDSFFEYFLAYYFYWQEMEDIGAEAESLALTEVPDYMKELVTSEIYNGNHRVFYLRLVLERLFYIRNYRGIVEILEKAENFNLLKTDDRLWYCLLQGCYFARDPEKGIDELRAVKFIWETIEPDRLFNRENLAGDRLKVLSEACYTLLNILFDNNLMGEYFRLAYFLEKKTPTMEVYGLLSRGFLKIGQVERSLHYLDLKEQEIEYLSGGEKHRVRLYAEKGLAYYCRFKSGRNHEDYLIGIAMLEKAEKYYRDDKREEGNYLFTLREFLRFYLEARRGEEFDRVIARLEDIDCGRHPGDDYIPFLLGLKQCKLEKNNGAGIKNLLKGAEGFYRNKHFLEAVIVYLWLYHYTRGRAKKDKFLKKAANIMIEAHRKQNSIKNYWHFFDRYLQRNKVKTDQEFLRGAGAVFLESAPACRRQKKNHDIQFRVQDLLKKLEVLKPGEYYHGLSKVLWSFVLIA